MKSCLLWLFCSFGIATATIATTNHFIAHAQQAPAPHPATAAPVKPPTITDAQKAAYWKATTQQAAAQRQSEAANAAVQTAVQAMVAACGSDATLQQAPNGDPECVAKVEPKK